MFVAKSASLVYTCAKEFRWELLLVVPPRMALIGFNFAQPFLISRLIKFLTQSESEETYNTSLGLIAAAAIIYLGIAICTVRNMHQLYRVMTMLRGALTRLISNKTLVVQDGVFDDSAALTLMSTDIDRIAVSLQNMNEVWARTLEVAIGIWLLAEQLGWIAVLPIVLIVGCALLNTRLAKFVSGKQKIWNGAVQKRIGATASMLSSIKTIKMMGLSGAMSGLIQNLRIDEIHSASGFRWLIVFTNMIGTDRSLAISGIPLTLPSIYTAHLVTSSDLCRIFCALTTNKAFTSLSILTLTTQPASMLLTAITDTAACLGCFKRIEKFLLTSSRDDVRRSGTRHTSEETERSKTSDDPARDGFSGTAGILLGDVRPIVAHGEPPAHSVSTVADDSCSFELTVRDCTVRPSTDCKVSVSGVNIGLARGQIVVIAGPVGCGKTTLLKAILGEIRPEQGSISVRSRLAGYCAQEPWIPNTSLRQIITGLAINQAVNESWYAKVISACALTRDFELLSDGDSTVAGSGGITLSGGQKQRIALARAVYSRNSILVLDDVFSALDTSTESTIITRLFGKAGLLRGTNTTAVIATHSPMPLTVADQIIVLRKDGSVERQGNLETLRGIHGVSNDDVLNLLSAERTEQAGPPQTTSKAVRGPSANDISDLTRRTGDIAVYMYYFRSAGYWALAIFILFSAVFVFTSYFPQVWLAWWSEDDHPNFARYISVYIILALLAWTFRMVTLAWMLVYISPKSSKTLHTTMLKTTLKSVHPTTTQGLSSTGIRARAGSVPITGDSLTGHVGLAKI
ncbi:putative multidrug resistance protein [Aureobasidium subglaciale]|nr:putative multidrug resistance protein [Aureobasidium subglaciale]KAI5213608.1 putative multidrug resistance protein [Aureobasidium subglaciale]KAI5215267.1 putative multidrug resistance protein [Aureobasidium subglaciale]KAI5253255.1 putative multidrug resistance protein [Aureobasidium subglaciale]